MFDRRPVWERMARLTAALMGILMVPGAAAPAAQPSQPASPLVARERAFFEAMHRKDAAALEAMLTPDFVSRGQPDVDRATWLKNALSLCWGRTFDLDEMRVREVDGGAVVSFVLTFYQDPETCEPASLRSLITDVWVQDGAAWRLAVRHSGPAGGGVSGQFGRAPAVPPLLAATGEVSLVATGGNSSTSTVGASADLEHNLATAHTTGRVAFVRSSADGEENARSVTATVRHGRALSPKVELLARGGYLRDRFAGLEHRVTVNGGVAAMLTPAPRSVTVDAAVGGVFESRLSAEDRRFVSAILGLSFDWNIRPGTEFHLRSEETSNLEDAADWRFANDASLVVALNGALSARFAYATRYVHEPVPGYRRTDTQATASLVIRLVRQAR